MELNVEQAENADGGNQNVEGSLLQKPQSADDTLDTQEKDRRACQRK